MDSSIEKLLVSSGLDYISFTDPRKSSNKIIYLEFVNVKDVRCIVSYCEASYVLTLGDDLVFYVYKESLEVILPMLKDVINGVDITQTVKALEKTQYDNQSY